MSLDDLQAQLRGALDQQFAALKTHHENAVADARRQARADAEEELQATLGRERAQWEEQLNAAVAAVRAEADQVTARVREEAERATAAARAEAEQAATARASAEQAAAAARAEVEQAVAARVEAEQSAAAARAGAQQAAADAQQAIAAAQAGADHAVAAAHADADQAVAAARAEADQAAAAARAEADQAVAAAHAAAQQASAAAEVDLRREFESARDEAVAAARRSAEQEFDAQLRRAAREIETERERAKAILEEAKAAIAGERERANETLEEVRANLESDLANAREVAAREAAVAAAAKAQLLSRASAAAAAASAAASVAMYDRVATGIRTLDGTTALGPALDALVTHAGAVSGRAALFVINGDRLKAWKSVGIPDIDVQTVESSIAGRDLLAKAVQAGQATTSGPSLPAPPFARLIAERPSLAVPLMIGGRAVAVLYVDGGTDRPATVEWQGAVDLLARHASALLALRTAMRTFDVLRGVPDANGNGNGDGGEEGARRYAKLLVSEIKLYNEGAVRAGRQQRDLSRRLQAEIERARRFYQERVSPAVSARDQYFQQELVQTLADGDATLLGN